MSKIWCGHISVPLALACGLLILTAPTHASDLVRASNGNPVGPVLVQNGGDPTLMAMLEIGDGGPVLPGERIFSTRFESGFDATNGFVEVFLDRDGLTHPYAPYVYFSAPACEGSPFVSQAAMHPAVSLRAAIVGAGAELFLATSNQAQLQTVASLLDASGCRPFDNTIRAYPLRDAGSLFERLPPPYTVGATP